MIWRTEWDARNMAIRMVYTHLMQNLHFKYKYMYLQAKRMSH